MGRQFDGQPLTSTSERRRFHPRGHGTPLLTAHGRPMGGRQPTQRDRDHEGLQECHQNKGRKRRPGRLAEAASGAAALRGGRQSQLSGQQREEEAATRARCLAVPIAGHNAGKGGGRVRRPVRRRSGHGWWRRDTLGAAGEGFLIERLHRLELHRVPPEQEALGEGPAVAQRRLLERRDGRRRGGAAAAGGALRRREDGPRRELVERGRGIEVY